MRKKPASTKTAAKKKPTATKTAAKTKPASKKTITHAVIKVMTKGARKMTRTGIRPPLPPAIGSATDPRAIGTQLDASFLSKKWSKVTLTARKTYSTPAQLVYHATGYLDAEKNHIYAWSSGPMDVYVGVRFNAPKVGDNYLIKFVIDVINRDSEFEIRASGTGKTSMKLAAGNHELLVVAVPKVIGPQSVDLYLTHDAFGFYLHRIEIQPLDS